jgi:hypothetical protein
MPYVSLLFILCFSSFLSFVLSNSGERELEINFPPTHATCIFYVSVQSEEPKKKKKKGGKEENREKKNACDDLISFVLRVSVFFLFFLLPNGRVTHFISVAFLVLSFPSMLSMAFSLPAQIRTAPPSTQVYHSPTSPWLASLTHPAFQSRRVLSTFSADIPQPEGAATCWPSPASFHPPKARLSFPLLLRCEETKSVF